MNWFFRFVLVMCLVSCTSTPPVNHSSLQERRDEIGQLQTLRFQIRSLVERREFLKSLRLMQQEVNQGLSETSLVEEYGLALRGGILYGEELSKKESFSECGIYLQQLVKLYPRNLPALPGVSAGQIRQKINSCSDQLMVQGLAAYRAGEMQEAINLWTQLLVFNPERTEAEKAIDTCSIQLRNMKLKP